MKLSDYLLHKQLSVKQFAEKNGFGIQNVYYWMRGAFKPNKFHKLLIDKATKGQVTDKDW